MTIEHYEKMRCYYKEEYDGWPALELMEALQDGRLGRMSRVRAWNTVHHSKRPIKRWILDVLAPGPIIEETLNEVHIALYEDLICTVRVEIVYLIPEEYFDPTLHEPSRLYPRDHYLDCVNIRGFIFDNIYLVRHPAFREMALEVGFPELFFHMAS